MRTELTLNSVPEYGNSELYAKLDGRITVINGIEGKIEHRVHRAIYPYEHIRHQLFWTPTKRGMRTEAYRKTREEMGDDWSTDLGESFDLLCEVANRVLGADATLTA